MAKPIPDPAEIPLDVAEILAALDEADADAVYAFVRRLGAVRERRRPNKTMTTPRPRPAPRPVKSKGPAFWLSTREDPIP